ncbi:MAG: hypothetical protein JW855_04490 [Gammaproteobacteria bacterium]|nr:hypothetical protein [Gammaproteobacteria bacterium]
MKTVQGFHPPGVLRTPKFVPNEFLMKTVQGFHPPGVLRTPKFVPNEFFWIPDQVRMTNWQISTAPKYQYSALANNSA